MTENNNQLNIGAIKGRGFCKLPNALTEDENLRAMSVGAKFLYPLLLNRRSLSIANGWFDEEGRPYIYYSHKAIMEDLNVSSSSATRYLNELVRNGLVMRRHQGFGRPDVLYVLDILADRAGGEEQCLHICDAVSSDSAHSVSNMIRLDSSDLNTNKTDKSKTKKSNSFTHGMIRHDDHRTPEQELDDLYRERYGCTLSEMQAGLRTGGGA